MHCVDSDVQVYFQKKIYTRNKHTNKETKKKKKNKWSIT